ncbi:MAG: DUF488 domain-containing protein [Streptomyces sp.]|nr:DUF488 domain-containing protein [Streptomyces sp.]
MTERVYTVGHSTREFEELLAILRSNGVRCLVDVRSFPSSRKFPQWNRSAITENMPGDIEYRWIRKLGGRRHTPKGTPSENGAWRVRAFRDYADYMATEEFREGLDELLAVAERKRPAVMCSEALPWRCHRRLITDALIIRDVEVLDIMSDGRAREATLSAHAVVRDGRLTYPPPS